jgi:hypothetical protein
VTEEGEPTPPTPLARRLLVGFGRFWWDFLVGDTPELLVGAVGVLTLIGVIGLDHALRGAAAVLLPLLVAAVLGVSVWRAVRAGRS